MSIRHAILGLLDEQPMHGYRLKTAFERRMSPLWGLTTGQIYQSLAALERAALVESSSERKGRRPTRRIYTITPAGRRELASWLQAKPVAWQRPFREDILIRLMMLRETDAANLWISIRHQEHEARTRLLRIAHMRREHPPWARALDLGRIFLDGMLQQLQADLRNLEMFREAIEAWARQTGIALDRPTPTVPAPAFHSEIEISARSAQYAVL